MKYINGWGDRIPSGNIITIITLLIITLITLIKKTFFEKLHFRPQTGLELDLSSKTKFEV
jgi:hypothetical protein